MNTTLLSEASAVGSTETRVTDGDHSLSEKLIPISPFSFILRVELRTEHILKSSDAIVFDDFVLRIFDTIHDVMSS